MSALLSALATCVVHWSLLRAQLDACVAVQPMPMQCLRATGVRESYETAASFDGMQRLLTVSLATKAVDTSWESYHSVQSVSVS